MQFSAHLQKQLVAAKNSPIRQLKEDDCDEEEDIRGVTADELDKCLHKPTDGKNASLIDRLLVTANSDTVKVFLGSQIREYSHQQVHVDHVATAVEMAEEDGFKSLGVPLSSIRLTTEDMHRKIDDFNLLEKFNTFRRPDVVNEELRHKWNLGEHVKVRPALQRGTSEVTECIILNGQTRVACHLLLVVLCFFRGENIPGWLLEFISGIPCTMPSRQEIMGDSIFSVILSKLLHKL